MPMKMGKLPQYPSDCLSLSVQPPLTICFFCQVSVEHGFETNMKVEAVNPANSAQVCPATITRIVDQLMWLHLDSEPETVSSFVTSTESHDIFPVGWCESNGYELKPPLTWKRKRTVIPQPKYVSVNSLSHL